MELDERYIYRVDVLATAYFEAIEKVNAFYIRYRLPVIKYQEEGLTAILLKGYSDIPRDEVKARTSPSAVQSHGRPVSMYSMEMHERYVSDVKVVATSTAEARKRLNAFYARQRKPETRYQKGDVIAALLVKSVRRRRRASS